jgi:hypothetical protein
MSCTMYDVVPETFVASLVEDVAVRAAAASAAAQLLEEKLAAIKEDRCSIEEQLADIKTDRETINVRNNELVEYALVLDNKAKSLKFRELELDESISANRTQKKLFLHQLTIFIKQKRIFNKILMKQAKVKKQG